MTVEDLLAALVVDTPHAAIPAPARASAIRQLMDAVGVSLAAAAEPAGRVIAGVVAASSGSRQARVVGTNLWTSATEAAWANGSFAHLLDFDDTGFSHPTACLAPVVLAVGEWLDVSGRDVVDAMVLGYEVFERLAVCARPDEPILRQRGIHPTSVWGGPAAAAVAGRLLHLDVDQMRVALGLAASNAMGLTQQFGTWAKGLSAGHAARSGILAGLLAQAGYHGDEQGISGPYGLFAAVIGAGHYDLAAIGEDLGERWSIADPGLSIKPYPACTSTLRAVDAMLTIAEAAEYSPEGVEAIVVHVHPDLLHTLRHRAPTQGFRGKFSLDYTVAAAALDRSLTIESFNQESAGRPALRAMLERVELRLHPEWSLTDRYRTPVEVRLDDGSVLKQPGDTHRGSRVRPLTAEQIDGKYLSCAIRSLAPQRAAASLGALHALDGALSVRAVVDLLVPPS